MKDDFKIIPKKERPREKALYNGIDSLSNEELLALILRCGTKNKNVIELATFIMKKYYTFNNLINCTYEELIKIEGIKQAKAVEILAIMEISKRIQKNRIGELKKINSPEDIYKHFSLLINEEKQEVFMVIFLNIKSHIIKYEKLFIGGVNSSIIDINVIFKKAINYGASKIICLHNHPSGDSSPSTQDVLITKKIMKVGEIVSVPLVDHIIIGKGNYTSLKKESYI